MSMGCDTAALIYKHFYTPFANWCVIIFPYAFVCFAITNGHCVMSFGKACVGPIIGNDIGPGGRLENKIYAKINGCFSKLRLVDL